MCEEGGAVLKVLRRDMTVGRRREVLWWVVDNNYLQVGLVVFSLERESESHHPDGGGVGGRMGGSLDESSKWKEILPV